VHSIAILEWKANQPRVYANDVAWLIALSASRLDFTGYAICRDRQRKNPVILHVSLERECVLRMARALNFVPLSSMWQGRG